MSTIEEGNSAIDGTRSQFATLVRILEDSRQEQREFRQEQRNEMKEMREMFKRFMASQLPASPTPSATASNVASPTPQPEETFGDGPQTSQAGTTPQPTHPSHCTGLGRFAELDKQQAVDKNILHLQVLRALQQDGSVAYYWIIFTGLRADISFDSEQQIIDIFVDGLKSNIQQELKRVNHHCTSLLFTYRLALFFELCQSGYYEQSLEDQKEEPIDLDPFQSVGPILQWLYIIMKASSPHHHRSKPPQFYSVYLLW